jgi:hypothetical protein
MRRFESGPVVSSWAAADTGPCMSLSQFGVSIFVSGEANQDQDVRRSPYTTKIRYSLPHVLRVNLMRIKPYFSWLLKLDKPSGSNWIHITCPERASPQTPRFCKYTSDKRSKS